MSSNKYGAKKTEVDGIVFDSKAEAQRYTELKLLVYNGDIDNLIFQPKFVLQPPFRDQVGKRHRAIHYQGDFEYTENDQRVIEEVKGFETKTWLLKKKMFLYQYPDLKLRIIK